MSDEVKSNERAQLFVTVGDEAQIVEGELLSVNNGLFVIDVEQNSLDAELGSSVVLYFPDSSRERALTVIAEYEGSQIHCQQGEHIAPDKRAFPRLFAGIMVQYQVVSAADSEPWYKKQAELPDEWHSTDEYMNFSVTGLAFDGSGSCTKDELLALRISVGAESNEWRAIAKAVRVKELKDYEQEELANGEKTVCNVAVFFETIPDECAQALEDLTNRVLDRS